ncbi:MAG: transcription-repair coupling factor [Verrucomicrobiota bacterium]|nr:transcription-repair coupling factor [Verrucomicrobiota bacterium]
MAENRSEETAGDLFSTVLAAPAAQFLQQRLEAGGALSCADVSSAAQPFLAVLLHKIFPQRPIVIVTDGLKTQESFQQDIETWLMSTVQSPKSKGQETEDLTQNSKPKTQNLFFPAWEVLPHESKLPHADVVSERLETLVALAENSKVNTQNSKLVVTNVVALLQKTFSAEEIKSRTRHLKRGDKIEPLDLIEWLEEQGYEPEAQVSEKGEIALRGGILDLFPLISPWPVRLEFFGDELESLRYFDPFTQISKEEISGVIIPPGGELGILKKSLESADTRLKTQDFSTLLDYLPCETIFLLCGPELLEEQANRYAQQVPDNDPFFISWKKFQEELVKKEMTTLALSELAETDMTRETRVLPTDEQNLNFQSLEIFRPIGNRPPEPQIAEAQRREFFSQLQRWARQNYSIHIFCNNNGERERFEEIWKEYFPSPKSQVQSPKSREAEQLWTLDIGLWTHLGALARGFLFEAGKMVVVTDAEIFGRYKVLRPRRLKSPHAPTSHSLLDIDFTELEEGDYVVHLQHGIGRYRGLQTMPESHGKKGKDNNADLFPPSENNEEYLVLEYAPQDPTQPAPKLFVPVSQAHLVNKYIGTGQARPPLHQLGGTRWAKTKQQAEHAVRDLASDLLIIQAARASQAGHAFSVDASWQREFESSFLYEETPDQWRAIVETKNDMESAKPMDRLICGDVGYGKTEVAIRAAFKAVMDGKQVAILVPTTVLAQQHFNTFRERMSDYPISIELLSRFRSAREQKKIVENLAADAVDIIIGTHRLVQPDIHFKDLGLVIVDEEQRFGVKQKEKFKQLRKLVDVLTLSATPIPRTLYLALTGARDMSAIETPPQDRLPVETIVAQYDERLIRDAIQRELNRQGQVFFLHNRVSTIDAVAIRLKTLLPNARIVVGHGQMHADDLEEVMTKFVNGEADVLLSTTIIESGLDIPNANTILIDRADRFGLSELYQLRGRVGRYKHQAYAYLLLPRHAGLLEDARKRISAIKQYSSLGSGFKIAMRDLEIRGAGNLLGPQQSGHIAAVGFELYCQLLKQSVSVLKGERIKPRLEVQMRLDFLSLNQGDDLGFRIQDSTGIENRKSEIGNRMKTSACFPLSYIAEAQQRIEIYRKLAELSDNSALENLKIELRDRFGPLPPAAELLLQVSELKILAAEKNITILETKEEKLMLTRHNDFIMLNGKFPRLTKTKAGPRLHEIKKLLLTI